MGISRLNKTSSGSLAKRDVDKRRGLTLVSEITCHWMASKIRLAGGGSQLVANGWAYAAVPPVYWIDFFIGFRLCIAGAHSVFRRLEKATSIVEVRLRRGGRVVRIHRNRRSGIIEERRTVAGGKREPSEEKNSHHEESKTIGDIFGVGACKKIYVL